MTARYGARVCELAIRSKNDGHKKRPDGRALEPARGQHYTGDVNTRPRLYASPSDWRNASHKRVSLFGMSGLGKTRVSSMLRDEDEWFHYSVDFRIGTRYMGEHIVDNFKHEAMRNPFLRDLLRSDSIYIASNITFKNLSPLSTYLGKPGDPELGGIPFEEYITRQRQHRVAEIAATRDAVLFIRKATDIYGYDNFICDTSGSLCEIVDADDPSDPVLIDLSNSTLPVWIRGGESHLEELCARFDRAPKPMYYPESFLRDVWDTYLQDRGLSPAAVDPDEFVRHGFRALMDHRVPRYQAIADNWGVTVDAADVEALRDSNDFTELVAEALGRSAD